MFSIPYSKYEEVLTDIYKKLNGKVNTIILSQNLIFNYDEFPRSIASQMFGTIQINMHNLSEMYGQLKFFTLCGQLVFIIIHELSHIEQDVNFYRYSEDWEYSSHIELCNNANSYAFFNDNYDYIQSIFPDYNFEYLDIKNNCLELKDIFPLYKKVSYHKYMENLFDGYIFPLYNKVSNYNYDKYKSIRIETDRDNIFIKEDGQTIRNNIYTINNIFEKLSNNGCIISNYNDSVKITVMDDDSQELMQVAYRV